MTSPIPSESPSSFSMPSAARAMAPVVIGLVAAVATKRLSPVIARTAVAARQSSSKLFAASRKLFNYGTSNLRTIPGEGFISYAKKVAKEGSKQFQQTKGHFKKAYEAAKQAPQVKLMQERLVAKSAVVGGLANLIAEELFKTNTDTQLRDIHEKLHKAAHGAAQNGQKLLSEVRQYPQNIQKEIDEIKKTAAQIENIEEREKVLAALKELENTLPFEESIKDLENLMQGLHQIEAPVESEEASRQRDTTRKGLNLGLEAVATSLAARLLSSGKSKAELLQGLISLACGMTLEASTHTYATVQSTVELIQEELKKIGTSLPSDTDVQKAHAEHLSQYLITKVLTSVISFTPEGQVLGPAFDQQFGNLRVINSQAEKELMEQASKLMEGRVESLKKQSEEGFASQMEKISTLKTLVESMISGETTQFALGLQRGVISPKQDHRVPPAPTDQRPSTPASPTPTSEAPRSETPEDTSSGQ